MSKLLKKEFFARKTLKVARELIGCFLVRKINGKSSKFIITETEAYIGPHDLACHSSKGRTRRNGAMFKEAGTIYVYFVYGMHYMLNIVTEKVDYPSAVLIRGLEGISGPGRVTKRLKIDKSLNGKKTSPLNSLWLEEGQIKISASKIEKSPRVGVNYAGPIWAKKKYRFRLKY